MRERNLKRHSTMHAYGKHAVKLITYFQEKVSSTFISPALLQELARIQRSSFFTNSHHASISLEWNTLMSLADLIQADVTNSFSYIHLQQVRQSSCCCLLCVLLSLFYLFTASFLCTCWMLYTDTFLGTVGSWTWNVVVSKMKQTRMNDWGLRVWLYHGDFLLLMGNKMKGL